MMDLQINLSTLENLLLEIVEITENEGHRLVPYHWPRNEQTDMVTAALEDKLAEIGIITREARRLLSE